MDQKYLKTLFISALFFLTINQANAQYPGTNLRGQVQYQKNNNYFPLQNAKVDLYFSPSPNQFELVKQTITNGNGFYFFYGIQVHKGEYYIQVNKAKNYQIFVSKISYTNNQYNYNQFQDVPIIKLSQ
jgi:hypothetical protein